MCIMCVGQGEGVWKGNFITVQNPDGSTKRTLFKIDLLG